MLAARQDSQQLSAADDRSKTFEQCSETAGPGAARKAFGRIAKM